MQLGLNASSSGFSAFLAWDFGSRKQDAAGQTPARVIDVKPIVSKEPESTVPQRPAQVVEAANKILRYAPPRAAGQSPALERAATQSGQYIDTFA